MRMQDCKSRFAKNYFQLLQLEIFPLQSIYFFLLQAFRNTVLAGFLFSQMHQSSRLSLKTLARLVLKVTKGSTTRIVKVFQVCYEDKSELRAETLQSETSLYTRPPSRHQ